MTSSHNEIGKLTRDAGGPRRSPAQPVISTTASNLNPAGALPRGRRAGMRCEHRRP